MTQQPLPNRLRTIADTLKLRAEVRGKPEVSNRELMDAYYAMQEAADAVDSSEVKSEF